MNRDLIFGEEIPVYPNQSEPKKEKPMTLYRKKPVVIEAFRFRIDPIPDWFMDMVSINAIITHENDCEIKTLEGVMRGETGDYIIKGVKGEIYPCKPDIFALTYEPVDSTVEKFGGGE